jgi:hypothetical protein
MNAPKDAKEESFFRKVARFVTNPATDWTELNSRQDDPEGDQAKAELKAMIERKRRNDFVRKRELDMLRRIRREGLSPEQLAALGASSSRLDEIERAAANSEINNKIDPRVKDKINEIEQQMVGEAYGSTGHQHLSSGGQYDPTRPAHFSTTMPPPGGHETGLPTEPASASRISEYVSREERERLEAAPPPAAASLTSAGMPPPSDAPASRLPGGFAPSSQQPSSSQSGRSSSGSGSSGGPGIGASAPMPFVPAPELPPLSFDVAQAAPVNMATAAVVPVEFEHDPELDEAVIAFANADYDHAERVIGEMIAPQGPRHNHGATWLALFDLYRATGNQAKFEALAPDYVQQFGLSAPQWFSMPKQVAEGLKSVRAPMGRAGGVSWAAPSHLEVAAVSQLQGRCETLPLPWVLDWTQLKTIDLDAAKALRQLFRLWAGQQVDLRWIAGDQFLQLLKDLAPVAQRDVDAAYWMLRLEALRIVNRPDQFDEAAIDYCVTYEVSPPSWEKAQCRVRVSGLTLSTSGPASSSMQSVDHSIGGSSFLESTITEHSHLSANVQLELSGQLQGDISETLQLMTNELGAATLVTVACPKLMRLDFMAAGDLLNWVLARRSENRNIVFMDTHRLVALFFGAMGINEHARIRLRQN